jgi:site-specific recombinase XerD
MHAYATLMLEAGEDLAMVSRSLGHSNISTAADTYAHVTPHAGTLGRADGPDPRRVKCGYD